MKQKIITLCILFYSSFALAQTGYNIKVTVKPFRSGFLYLGYHFGTKQYLLDSARISPQGLATFQGKQKLFGGVYLIIYPRKNGWFEILIDKQQNFSVTTDSTDVLNRSQYVNSLDNQVFNQYQRFAQQKGIAVADLQKKLATAGNAADSASIRSQINAIGKEMQQYRENFIRNNPKSLLTALFRIMKDPEVPTAVQQPGGKYDSNYVYNYYKAHYWDGVSFSDDRLMRTPVLEPKLNKYFDNILIQNPDTLIKEADKIIVASSVNKETFKYYLSTLTDKYVNPTYMGQDKVFVQLFQKYYMTGQADYWMNEKYKKFIFDRGYSLMANVIGEKAANIELIDSSDKPLPLYSVKAPYTIICFWDPTCSHCQEIVPKLDSIYESKWKSRGVALYGVLVDGGKDQWLKYIKEHNLRDWIHVYQTQAMKDADYNANRAGFRQLYDVYQTPILYLLDNEKRIIAKKLTYNQLDDFLQVKMGNPKN
jgi:protein-disulfide isomerase-like protein with CxxC motif